MCESTGLLRSMGIILRTQKMTPSGSVSKLRRRNETGGAKSSSALTPKRASGRLDGAMCPHEGRGVRNWSGTGEEQATRWLKPLRESSPGHSREPVELKDLQIAPRVGRISEGTAQTITSCGSHHFEPPPRGNDARSRLTGRPRFARKGWQQRASHCCIQFQFRFVVREA